MGNQSTDDVKSPPPHAEVDAAEREIDVLRRRTEDLIGELERRVGGTVDRAKLGVDRIKVSVSRARQMADVPTQVRAHPAAAATIGAGTISLGGLILWRLFLRRAQDRRLPKRLSRRLRAYRALLADPESALTERGPSLRRRLVTALVMTAATTLMRRLVSRSVERALPA
jgi:hypothetical protein